MESLQFCPRTPSAQLFGCPSRLKGNNIFCGTIPRIHRNNNRNRILFSLRTELLPFCSFLLMWDEKFTKLMRLRSADSICRFYSTLQNRIIQFLCTYSPLRLFRLNYFLQVLKMLSTCFCSKCRNLVESRICSF